jgi:hypothetical protein
VRPDSQSDWGEQRGAGSGWQTGAGQRGGGRRGQAGDRHADEQERERQQPAQRPKWHESQLELQSSDSEHQQARDAMLEQREREEHAQLEQERVQRAMVRAQAQEERWEREPQKPIKRERADGARPNGGASSGRGGSGVAPVSAGAAVLHGVAPIHRLVSDAELEAAGWVQAFSTKRNKWYFYHKLTRTALWERPSEDALSGCRAPSRCAAKHSGNSNDGGSVQHAGASAAAGARLVKAEVKSEVKVDVTADIKTEVKTEQLKAPSKPAATPGVRAPCTKLPTRLPLAKASATLIPQAAKFRVSTSVPSQQKQARGVPPAAATATCGTQQSVGNGGGQPKYQRRGDGKAAAAAAQNGAKGDQGARLLKLAQLGDKLQQLQDMAQKDSHQDADTQQKIRKCAAKALATLDGLVQRLGSRQFLAFLERSNAVKILRAAKKFPAASVADGAKALTGRWKERYAAGGMCGDTPAQSHGINARGSKKGKEKKPKGRRRRGAMGSPEKQRKRARADTSSPEPDMEGDFALAVAVGRQQHGARTQRAAAQQKAGFYDQEADVQPEATLVRYVVDTDSEVSEEECEDGSGTATGSDHGGRGGKAQAWRCLERVQIDQAKGMGLRCLQTLLPNACFPYNGSRIEGCDYVDDPPQLQVLRRTRCLKQQQADALASAAAAEAAKACAPVPPGVEGTVPLVASLTTGEDGDSSEAEFEFEDIKHSKDKRESKQKRKHKHQSKHKSKHDSEASDPRRRRRRRELNPHTGKVLEVLFDDQRWYDCTVVEYDTIRERHTVKWEYSEGEPGKRLQVVKLDFEGMRFDSKRPMRFVLVPTGSHQRWSVSDDALLRKEVGEKGTNWDSVAENLPEFSGNECRGRWRELQRLMIESLSSTAQDQEEPLAAVESVDTELCEVTGDVLGPDDRQSPDEAALPCTSAVVLHETCPVYETSAAAAPEPEEQCETSMGNANAAIAASRKRILELEKKNETLKRAIAASNQSQHCPSSREDQPCSPAPDNASWESLTSEDESSGNNRDAATSPQRVQAQNVQAQNGPLAVVATPRPCSPAGPKRSLAGSPAALSSIDHTDPLGWEVLSSEDDGDDDRPSSPCPPDAVRGSKRASDSPIGIEQQPLSDADSDDGGVRCISPDFSSDNHDDDSEDDDDHNEDAEDSDSHDTVTIFSDTKPSPEVLEIGDSDDAAAAADDEDHQGGDSDNNANANGHSNSDSDSRSELSTESAGRGGSGSGSGSSSAAPDENEERLGLGRSHSFVPAEREDGDYIFEVSSQSSSYYVEEMAADEPPRLWDSADFHLYTRFYHHTPEFRTSVLIDAEQRDGAALLGGRVSRCAAGCINMSDRLWKRRSAHPGHIPEEEVEGERNCEFLPGFTVQGDRFLWTRGMVRITREVRPGEFLETDYGSNYFWARR